MTENTPNKQIFGVLLLIVVVFVCAFWPHSVTRKLKFSWKDGNRKSDSREQNLRLDGNRPYQYRRQDPFQHRRQLEILGKLVQSRLRILQNPVSCKTTKKIKCLVHGCGLGCQVNTVSMCLMLGYALNRTVVVEPPLTSVIQPLSTTCTSADEKNSKAWAEDFARFQVVEVRILGGIQYKPDFFPPAIPDDLADRIIRLHRDPFLWWTGQISSYILKPTEATAEFLEKEEGRLGFFSPIVGLHIRRTDKLTSAGNNTFHAVEEYMVLAEKWYEELEKRYPRVPRRVFLATDDPSTKQEINIKYPEYSVLHNDNYSQSAENLKERRTEYGKLGILHDVHMLSKCDYVICAFSSNICRLTHQLMQARRGNDTYSLISLDRKWYFLGWSRAVKRTTIPRAKMPVYGNPAVQQIISNDR